MERPPVLPGYIYDTERKRYFREDRFSDLSKLKRPNVTAEKNTRSVSEQQVCRNVPRSVTHHIISREKGTHPAGTMSASISATILSSQRRRRTSSNLSTSSENLRLSSSLAWAEKDGRLRISAYPSGSIARTYLEDPYLMDRLCGFEDSNVGLTAYGQKGKRFIVFSLHNGEKEDMNGSIRPFRFWDTAQSMNCVSRSRHGGLAAGCDGHSVAFRSGRRPRIFPHPDSSSGICAAWRSRQQLLVGTRMGHVYLLDFRLRASNGVNGPASIIDMGEGKSVCAIKQSELSSSVAYVSAASLLNDSKYSFLKAWDFRYLRRELTTYTGHKNEHKRIAFDIEESSSGGLLASGGDDGMVRIWDLCGGGQPLSRINVGDQTPHRVKFVGWNRSLMSWNKKAAEDFLNPGIWVVTNSNRYIVQCDPSRT